MLPVSHALVAHGFGTLCREMGFGWLVGSGGVVYWGGVDLVSPPCYFECLFFGEVETVCVILRGVGSYDRLVPPPGL